MTAQKRARCRERRHAGDPGRRRSPLAVASVAAAVLLAGGGGAYFATTASGGGGARTRAPAGGRRTSPARPGRLPGAPAGGGTRASRPASPTRTAWRTGRPASCPTGPTRPPCTDRRARSTRPRWSPAGQGPGRGGHTDARDGSLERGRQQRRLGPGAQVTSRRPGSWTFTASSRGGRDNCPKGKSPCYATVAPRPTANGATAVSEADAKAARGARTEGARPGRREAGRDANSWAPYGW